MNLYETQNFLLKDKEVKSFADVVFHWASFQNVLPFTLSSFSLMRVKSFLHKPRAVE